MLRRLLCVASLAAALSGQMPSLPPPGDAVFALLQKPVTPAVPDGVPIEVTVGGTAVAGAEVAVIDHAALEAHAGLLRSVRRELQHALRYTELLAAWFGTRYRTGDDGTVVAAVPADVTVYARKGPHAGTFRSRQWRGQPIRVELERQDEVTVEVVRPDGRPARDVRVGVGWLIDASSGAGVLAPITFGTTGRDGRVRLALGMARGGVGGSVPGVEVQMVARAPVLAPLRAPADGAETEHVRLAMPATGQVRVILYDEKERPLARVTQVRIENADGDTFRFDSHMPSPFDRVDKDSAMFPHVELGMSLRARVTVRGLTGELTTVSPGPTVAGELVVIPVRMRASDPIVTLRVLGPDGQPVAGRVVQAVRIGPTGLSVEPCRTGPDGAVQLSIPRTWMQESVRELLVLDRSRSNADGGAGRAAEVKLPEILEGIVDLGEVRLLEQPVLLRGVVVDEADRPVPGVDVVVPFTRARARGVDWSPRDLDHRARSDAQGRFEVHELAPHAGAELTPRLDDRSARTWQLVGEPTFAAGATDAVLRVTRPAVLAVSLPGLPAGVEVEVFMLPEDSDPDEARWPKQRETLRAGADGAVTWRSAPRGKFDLYLGGRAGVCIPGVELRSGETSTDPRLTAVEWREKLILVELAVRDAQDQPVDARVRARPDAWWGGSSVALSKGRGRILVPREGTRLVVSHASCRTVQAAPAETLALTLRPRPLVRLTLPKGIELPAGVFLGVEGGDDLDRVQGSWSPGRALELRPDAVGACHCWIGVQPWGEPVWRAEVTIRDQADPQDLVLPIDADVVSAVHDALEAKKAGRRK